MNTSGRRRRQAANSYRHISPLRRPRYNVISKEKAAHRLARLLASEKARQQRKGR